MSQENVEIRKAARIADVPLWKIAKHIGISEPTLTRWLRDPLSEERKGKVTAAIHKLSQEAS